MQNKSASVKPADAIGTINYLPQRIETLLIVAGLAFTALTLISMVYGMAVMLLLISAMVLVAVVYVTAKKWAAMKAWFASHPLISTALHFSIVIVSFGLGFAMAGAVRI